MYEKILVPLDGSKVGEAALPYVEDLVSKLAIGTKVEVILFQVVTSLSHYVIAGDTSARIPYTEKELELIKNQSMEYLNKAAENMRNKGVDVKGRVVTGSDAAEEIIKFADNENIDLIAMSTHGRSGFSRWAFGSVAGKALRASTVPMLTVRATEKTVK